ncbi:unnamed protein product [Paramecium octaurelia]|uniref:Uncharacterized protein n=1 Tax=Paramecium octaurelia TaxID=43137 RepID=A0A8S1YK02_PAROT|nr:unnamed protein product [Paramecium octaurelia]
MKFSECRLFLLILDQCESIYLYFERNGFKCNSSIFILFVHNNLTVNEVFFKKETQTSSILIHLTIQSDQIKFCIRKKLGDLDICLLKQKLIRTYGPVDSLKSQNSTLFLHIIRQLNDFF